MKPLILLSALIGIAISPVRAAEMKTVPGGVGYEYIGEYTTDRLNKILTTEVADFCTFPITYPAAENAVKLYRVRYTTVIPEDNNRPVPVSGLIAIPEVTATTLPVVSYQHGTVFSRNEVPSSPEDSMETRLNIARFAGQGYIVIAADYIGKGISTEPDAYLVKDSTVQACLDMIFAARSICAAEHLTMGDLFLTGWSQGSYNTTILQHRLETLGEPVAAASVASAPNDLYLCVNRWINVRSPLDVNWLVGTTALLICSYEHYYQLPGLVTTAIRPEYQQTARDLYANKIDWTTAAKTLPPTAKELLQESFVQAGSLVSNRFFQILLNNRSYGWRFQTPTRFYYGQADEVVTPFMVNLPVEYQKTLGGAPSEGIFAGEKATHRGTFLFSVKDEKHWFDSLRKK